MRVLLEIEDRVRPDSTCVYFKNAFEKLVDLVVVHPEELEYIKPGKFDLHIRIDYGINNPFPKELKPSVFYAIDTHIDLDWRLEMAKKSDFDYVFCAQKRSSLEKWHTDKVFFMPLACEPETHCPQGARFKKYDICFIGNCQPFWQARRVERLNKVFKEFPNFYTGNKFFKEATEKYAESKIVFNSAQGDDINMRVFEAMASGSLLVTDKQDWQGLFEPGKHFVEYDGDVNMLDQIHYYLLHDDKRELIAKSGKQEVLEKHTYLLRAQEILDKFKKENENGTN